MIDYQAFPYDYFCKPVYEIKQKGLAGPYWQVKRNKTGREQHRLETDEMRKKWALNVEMEETTDMFKHFPVRGSNQIWYHLHTYTTQYYGLRRNYNNKKKNRHKKHPS